MGPNNHFELFAAVADVLRVDVHQVQASANSTFADLGGDSVGATQLAFKADNHGIDLNVSSILSDLTMGELQEVCLGNRRNQHLDQLGGHLPSKEADFKPYSLVVGDLDAILKIAAAQIGCERSAIRDLIPCTSGQASMWRASQSSPGTNIFQRIWKLPHLDLERFKAAWQAVADVTPVLNARCVRTEDNFYMLALMNEPLVWTTTRTNIEHLKKKPLPEMRPGSPLSHFELHSSFEHDTVYFRLVMHHMLHDRWSFLELTLNDFHETLNSGGLIKSRPSLYHILHAEKSLPLQEAEDYWRTQLQQCPPLDWPKRPSDHHKSRTSSSIRRTLSLPSKPSVNFTGLVAASWSFLLSQYTLEERVCFGIATWGRTLPVKQAVDIAFPTSNVVPMVELCSGDRTFADMASEIQHKLIDYSKYQSLGIPKISQVSTAASWACSFDNMLVVQPAVSESPQAVLSSESLEYLNTTLPKGVVVGVSGSFDNIVLKEFYDQELFSASAAAAILTDLNDIITQASKNPGMFLHDLILESRKLPPGTAPATKPPLRRERLSSDEIETIHRLNKDGGNYSQMTLSEMTFSTAKESPDNVALYATSHKVTYGELEQRCDHAAVQLLGRLGRGPGFIMICFDNSTDGIIAMLAIMRIGKSFVPIDPSTPPARINEIYHQTKAQATLGSKGLIPLLETTEVSCIIEWRTLEDMDGAVETDLDMPRPEDLAYTIFTSGSTGKPKGVAIEHRTICHTLRAFSAIWGLNENSRVMQLAAFSFDVSVMEIFCCLGAGGTLCIPAGAERLNTLDTFMIQAGVTDAIFTPTMMQTVMPEHQKQLRTLVTGGEAVTAAHLQGWLDLPELRLIEGYGPTEASCICFANTRLSKNNASNIGLPLACRAFVVDGDLQLLRPGKRGELLIAGPLARGYLNDDEMTNRKFVWVSFPELPSFGSMRAFKTGDEVSMAADGSFTYHSRLDLQVKLGGIRIELGEIENVLSSGEGLADECIAAVTEHDGTEELALFFVPYGNKPSPQTSQLTFLPLTKSVEAIIPKLRALALRELTRQMIPSIYLPVSVMPATPNAKVDRHKLTELLKDLAANQLDVYRVRDGPALCATPHEWSDNEQVLRKAWSKVLRRNEVEFQANDGFMSMGGDSIAAIKLQNELLRMNVDLPLAAVYRYPTLQGMASAMRVLHVPQPYRRPEPFEVLAKFGNGRHSKQAILKVVEHAGIDPRSVVDAFPSYSYATFFFRSHVGGKEPRMYYPSLAFELSKAVTPCSLQQAITRLYQMTPSLRSRIVRSGEHNFYIVLDKEDDKVESYASYAEFKEKEGTRQVKYNERLARCSLVNHDSKLYLMLTLHHVQYDGWGLSLLMNDLEDILRGFPRPLERPSASLFIYHLLQEQPLATSFWRPHLSGIRALPCTKDAAARLSSLRARSSVVIKTKYTASTQLNLPLPTLLYAAMTVACHKVFEGTCTAFYLLNTGRRSLQIPGIEDLTGPVIMPMPFPVSIQTKQTYADVATHCHEFVAATMPYEHDGMRLLHEMCPNLLPFLPLLNIYPKESRMTWCDEFMTFSQDLTLRGLSNRAFNVDATPEFDHLMLSVKYDERIFNGDFAETFIRAFEAALMCLDKQPHARVDGI